LELGLNQQPKAIIPIPLHGVKLRERGFNQVETIARILSSHTNIRIEENLLRRVKMTDSQTHLSRSKRISNVKNAFICTRQILKGCYLLVDDVMTTGSTANACAKALLDNGASSIEVLTITRGIPG
jgi:ComF family protein